MNDKYFNQFYCQFERISDNKNQKCNSQNAKMTTNRYKKRKQRKRRQKYCHLYLNNACSSSRPNGRIHRNTHTHFSIYSYSHTTHWLFLHKPKTKIKPKTKTVHLPQFLFLLSLMTSSSQPEKQLITGAVVESRKIYQFTTNSPIYT